MANRRVEVPGFLVEHAGEAFPPGGSAGGTPSYEQFEAGPLEAAKLYFSHRFDESPDLGGGIRAWVTIDTPFFPPLAWYACLGTEGHGEEAEGDLVVTLLDVTIEEPQDYWAQVGDDPVA
jgi:hypothetical protein